MVSEAYLFLDYVIPAEAWPSERRSAGVLGTGNIFLFFRINNLVYNWGGGKYSTTLALLFEGQVWTYIYIFKCLFYSDSCFIHEYTFLLV